MAIKKINTDLQIEAGLLDGDGNSGTNNQILISTGTGIDWVNASTVTGGPYLPLSAGSGEILTGDLAMNNNIGIITKDSSGAFRDILKLNSSNVLEIGSSSLTTDTIFKNTGNVGIGTTSPGVKLQVNGGIRAVGTTSTTGQIDASPVFGAFRFYNGSTFRGGLGTGQWAGVGNSTDIVQYLNNVNYYISNGTTALVKVETGGNVGIGTTSPSATFVVQPSETSFNLAGLANGQIALGNNTSSGKAPTIGSRTTSTGQPPLQFITGQPDTSTVPGMIFSVREDNNSDFGTTANKPAYDFTRYTTSLLRITRDGKVGIGTASPTGKLEVVGTTFINDGVLKITQNAVTNYYGSNQMHSYGTSYDWKFSGSNVMRITSAGNLGIGTASPASKLEVDGGDIEVDDSASGLILRSPDGTRYRITVANGGTLAVTAV
jgi:hypothetical protein